MGYIQKRAAGTGRGSRPARQSPLEDVLPQGRRRAVPPGGGVDKVRGLGSIPEARMPLAVWAEEFMSLCRRLSPTTQETYRRDLDRYVLPRFGAYRIGHLPADEIENWLNDEIAAGIAPSSVHRHYRTLRRVLQVAVQKQKILTNPCDRVDPPSAATRDDVPRLGSGCWLAEAHAPLPSSDLPGGGRRDAMERAGGSPPGKVDSNAGRSESRNSWFSWRTASSCGRSRRPRPAPVDHDRAVNRAPRGTPGPLRERRADGLVFPNGAGNPLSSSSFLTHHFSPARRRRASVQLPRPPPHQRRAAIAAGAHPKAIQARMGHSSINVTLDRYGHLFPELDEAIADSFDREINDLLFDVPPM